tara:strand:+ start:551 stop:1495 length:945 start_codon:yes stop_codon:yes gene_type:complete
MVEYSPYYTGAEQIMREAPDIEARKLGLIDTAKALTEKGYTLPDYILAGLTQDQKDAFALQRAGIGGFQPFMTQGAQALTTGLGTTAQAVSDLGQLGGAPTQAQLDAYMNPFQQSVIDATMTELDKQGALSQQQLAQTAQQAGAFGGSRFGVQQAQLGEGLQDAKARALAQLNLQNFGQAQAGVQNQLERERALALGAGALGAQQAQLGQGFAGLGAQQQALASQDASNLLGIGGLQQQYAQQEEDIKRQNLMQGIMTPYQQLGFYSDILARAPTTQQTLNVSQAAPISPLQAAIGTGVGAISGIAGLKKLGVV